MKRLKLEWAAVAAALLAGNSVSAQTTWDGGSLTDDNWTSAENWVDDLAPVSPAALVFDGTTRLTPNNDFAAATTFNGITFAATAGAFTLGGNSIVLGGNVINNSTALQTFNLPLSVTASRTFTTAAGGGDITLNGGYSASSGAFFTKNGAGTLNINSTFANGSRFFIGGINSGVVIGNGGAVTIASGGFSSIGMNNSDVASLTLQGNGSFSSVTEVAVADIGAATTPASGTLNISSANASFSSLRLVVGKGGNNVNAVGTGVANHDAGAVSLTGTGAGDGLLLGGRSGGAASSGTYNLNGGTLSTFRIGFNVSGTGRINFNGGTVKAIAANASFMNAHVNLTAAIQEGGAVIDTSGFNITIAEELQHDSALGATPDGGLRKIGAGTLTLTGANSYTGDTEILAGTLSIANATLADAADVYLTTGATLNLSFAGADEIGSLFFDNVQQAGGTWGAVGSGAQFETEFITGPGMLSVVPEPGTSCFMLLGGALMFLNRARSRK